MKKNDIKPTAKEYVIQEILLRGFINDNIIILQSRKDVHKEKIERVEIIAKRLGYNVFILYYEDYTNSKGKNCISDAITKISKNTLDNTRYFVGKRGTKYSEVRIYKNDDSVLYEYNFSNKCWERSLT